jgi:hypothetical protein
MHDPKSAHNKNGKLSGTAPLQRRVSVQSLQYLLLTLFNFSKRKINPCLPAGRRLGWISPQQKRIPLGKIKAALQKYLIAVIPA